MAAFFCRMRWLNKIFVQSAWMNKRTQSLTVATSYVGTAPIRCLFVEHAKNLCMFDNRFIESIYNNVIVDFILVSF